MQLEDGNEVRFSVLVHDARGKFECNGGCSCKGQVSVWSSWSKQHKSFYMLVVVNGTRRISMCCDGWYGRRILLFYWLSVQEGCFSVVEVFNATVRFHVLVVGGVTG